MRNILSSPDDNDHSTKWMYHLSFVSIFIYAGCIFLVVLNFLPFILRCKNIRVADLLISIAVLLFTAIYYIDFRPAEIMPSFPNGISIPTLDTGPILIPFILFCTISSNPIWMVLLAVPVSLTVCGAYKLAQSKDSDTISRICLCTLIFLF